jgi:chaperone required for assembly of F1-ATPase
MSGWKAKRFWKETAVEPVGGGFTVTLDGRPVRTPAKAPFVLPTRAMAEAAAAEWEAQEGEIRPETMPVTRMANSAIDTVADSHAEVVAIVAAYGETDLTCYRAEAPAELVALQAAGWDPLLDWAEAALDARLRPVAGVMHLTQEAAVLERLAAEVAAFDPFALAAFHDLVALSGSLVIGFAAARGHMEAEALWALSRLDEDWQAEQWGLDEEAAEHAALKRKAFLDAAHIFRLARRGG